MPELLYQSFSVTGVANVITYDGGITSTETEKKTIKSILVSTSAVIGNRVQVWLEREKKLEVYDYNLDTTEASGTNIYKSANKINELPLDVEVPVGQTLKVAILCGATKKNLYGAYKYQIA